MQTPIFLLPRSAVAVSAEAEGVVSAVGSLLAAADPFCELVPQPVKEDIIIAQMMKVKHFFI